ncbi:putative membrane protein [Deinobacterium chartae]|uniref:Putative membrane protein n=1 Tax=Deinobacterium chartae TaxID=521158 RepID=A0A841I4L7_9DEIO|nr:DUF2243 domain-containing protein [Deinobacterium chartae]MBB6099239.1 putative membrane protein [Deinobacterium chartae]
MTHNANNPANRTARTWVAGAVVMGMGMGGFVDGIVLHQILQWHHLLSEPYPPTSLENLHLNTLADGLFHALTWVFTLLGLLLLWIGARGTDLERRPNTLIGGLLAGWGLFNLIEGLVMHQVLGLHHVRPGPDELAYDLGYLALGALLLVAGTLLIRRGRRAT